MTDLARKIAARIDLEGPILFSTFMEMALYDPELGYYRGDPFGRQGDFFTASQLQPVFGAYVSTLAAQLLPGYETFLDIGGGRGELSSSFPPGVYRNVDHGNFWPETNRAILFSNELIDALPVDLDQQGNLLRVRHEGDHFAWHPAPPREGVTEIRPSLDQLLTTAYASLKEGSYILIDYGYRHRERARFPNGSLMSYRRHLATEDVLLDPGSRDITAHVDWDALIDSARRIGWLPRGLQSLRASIMDLGPDVLEGLNLLGELQLRTLLFGMGESFEVLILDKK